MFPAGIAPAANSYTLAGCCRSALVRGLSIPELYRTALTAAGAAISGARRIAANSPDSIASTDSILTATIGIGGTDTAEIGAICADVLEDGNLLIEGAAWPISEGEDERAFFGFEDTAEDPRNPHARGPGRGRRGQTARRRGPRRLVRHAVAQHGRPLPRGAPRRRGARALPVAHRSRDAGARRQEGRGIDRAGRGPRARAGALGAALPVREHAFTRRPASLSSGQYPHRRRLLRAGPPKEFRHGTHRPRIRREHAHRARRRHVGRPRAVLSGHASPYIVADGYDFESRSWGAGHYFTDIAEAKIDYEHSCRHPYPLAEGKLRDDEFCTIRWRREDVAAALSEYLAYPIPATEKNIDTAIGQLMAHDNFQDRSIEDGWETIGGIIVEDELDLGLSTKQGVDFYRDAFGLSNFTEAVIWPSRRGGRRVRHGIPCRQR